MHEKTIKLRQASLSRTIVFQALASLCTLKTAYKYEEIKCCQHNEARNKFLAYVDFANAKPYFQISLLKSLLFKALLKLLNADKI